MSDTASAPASWAAWATAATSAVLGVSLTTSGLDVRGRTSPSTAVQRSNCTISLLWIALWPIGKVGDGWLLLPTELDAVMDPYCWPDVCPLAGTLLAVAPLVGELLLGIALAIVPLDELLAVDAFAVALMAVGALAELDDRSDLLPSPKERQPIQLQF